MLLLGPGGARASGCPGDVLYPTLGGPAPTASVTDVSVGVTSATITATISPQNLSVEYYVIHSVGSGVGEYMTQPTPLGQCDGTATVQIPLTGLSGGDSYRFSLVIDSVAGELRTPTPEGQFTTLTPPIPSARPYRLTLKPSTTTLSVENAGLKFTGRIRGADFALSPDYAVNLLERINGAWRTLDFAYPTASGALRFTPSGSLDRNSVFKLQAPGSTDPRRPTSYSAPVTVYVYPRITLTAYRSNGPQISADYDAQTYVDPRVRRQRAYFYIQPTGSRRFVRVASASVHALGADAVATAKFTYRGAGRVAACTPHAIVLDMGRPFYDRSCGRARVG
jgi:hypothetical protein